jgi:polar amino acid transport system substrate-binding protein
MNTRTRTTARRAAALAAVAALTLTACGTGTPDRAPAASPAAAPVSAAPAAAAETCEGDLPPTASIAPDRSIDALRGPAKDELINQSRLIVGTSADVMLWGARDPKTGALDGFDIRLAKAIAKAMFNDERKIEFRVINYAQRLPALSNKVAEGQQESQPVDLVLHTMTINCKRWQQVAFSAEYYRAGQRILVRSDDPAFIAKKQDMQITDLPNGTEICVPDGSTNLELLKASYRMYKPVPVDEIGECLVKFQRGEVSVVTGDDTVLAGFAVQDPYARVVGKPLSVEPYGIGVGPQNRDLTMFVNRVLEQLMVKGADGKSPWQNIYAATMGQADPEVPNPPTPIYGRR